jgi:hypothetical protein
MQMKKFRSWELDTLDDHLLADIGVERHRGNFGNSYSHLPPGGAFDRGPQRPRAEARLRGLLTLGWAHKV